MNPFAPKTLRLFFNEHFELFILGVVAISIGFTYYMIPKIIWVVKSKRLVKEVNDRSSHQGFVASFGGVAFFTIFLLALACFQVIDEKAITAQLIAATTVLFMVGLKDDLIISTPRVKILGQMLAAGFIIFTPELIILDFHGFLGIGEVHEYVGYAFALFLILALVNSYNLIDGINGLAGMIGIVISLTYAYLFYSMGENIFVAISVTIAGMLAAFLRFNLSNSSKRIFMGDSGSLVIGLILAFLSIRLLATSDTMVLGGWGFPIENRILLISAILFVPMFDTIRVMIVRKLNGQSMFKPDKNHCHHILLNCNFTHIQASIFLMSVNIVVIVGVILLMVVFRDSSLWLHLGVLVLYLLVAFLFWRLRIASEVPQPKLHKEVRSDHTVKGGRSV